MALDKTFLILLAHALQMEPDDHVPPTLGPGLAAQRLCTRLFDLRRIIKKKKFLQNKLKEAGNGKNNKGLATRAAESSGRTHSPDETVVTLDRTDQQRGQNARGTEQLYARHDIGRRKRIRRALQKHRQMIALMEEMVRNPEI